MIPIAKPYIGDEEKNAVMDVLSSGMLASGPRTLEFERAFAQACEARFCLAMNSGTAALHAALIAAGVGPGDEVVTTPFTFVATANTILFAGAKPVFVDIDPATFNIDPAKIEAALTPRTKAILPVHLFGQAADMDPILAIARRHSLRVIEDACQSHGARYKGKTVGAIGDAGTFSFYPTKNMTVGEGGALTTNDDALAALANSFRNHGREANAALGTYGHVRLGHNLRSSDINSAIGIEQLKRLPGFNAKRRANAAFLTKHLAGVVETPFEAPGHEHVYHQYTIRVPDRAGFLARMKEAGVGTGVYYPTVLYEYAHLRAFRSDCPEAERATREVVALPVHPFLTQQDLETIVAAVKASL